MNTMSARRSKENVFSIVILDDNVIIRNIIKSELYKIVSHEFPTIEFDMYSSEDGVGGLGYIYITKPKVIIVDTTLPKYSGKEIFEFLQTNAQYVFENTLVLLITESKKLVLDLPKNFKAIDKSSLSFLPGISRITQDHMREILSRSERDPKVSKRNYFISILGRTTVFLANLSDKIQMARFLNKPSFLKVFKPITFILWLFFEVIVSFFYVLYIIIIGNTIGDLQLKTVSGDVSLRTSKQTEIIQIFITLIMTLIKLILFLFINVVILLISREL